jgi:parallel beta-helix repeat protein
MEKKSLSFIVCILFILFICHILGIATEKSSAHNSDGGITRYVGGTGPGNYSRIQDAINDSSDGDTVFVYDEGSPYYENIEIFRSITLLGEEKNTTVVHGVNGEDVIRVSENWVTISGFTIGDGGNGIYVDSDYNVIDANIIKWNRNDGISFSYHSQSNTVNGNFIWYNYIGTNLHFSDNNNITGNIICNNYFHGIYLEYSDSNTITGNNITDNRGKNRDGAGIYIKGSNNNMTGNSIVNNEDYGIYLDTDSNNTIIGNYIANNNWDGIFLEGCSFNKITGNTISDNGIYLFYSKNNIVSGNIILNNRIDCSNENNIYNNTFVNSSILLHGFNNNISNNSFFNGGLSLLRSHQNSISNNSVNGKPILLLEEKSNIIIDNVIAGQIIIRNCSNITVRNQEIFNTLGIQILGSNNCAISGNTISNNPYYGIRLSGDSNIIFNNTLTYSSAGISLDGDNNIISCNTIASNNGYGIRFYNSHGNNIINNTLTNNKGYGIYLNGDNNSISGNTIANNSQGDYISSGGINLYGDNNYISGNTITNNDDGLDLHYHSQHNTIIMNTVSKNSLAISLEESNNNTILKNNFLNNKRHAVFDNCTNIWSQNYWGRPWILPKLIFGTIVINSKVIPWFNFDRRPALKPYNIPSIAI